MLLSTCLDLPDGADDRAAVRRRLAEADAAGIDLIVIGREAGGAIVPGRLEALVTMPWAAGAATRAAIVGVLPAAHAMPFHVARALSAIDFLSGGRAGWLPVVTDRARHDAAYGAVYRLDEATAAEKCADFIRATKALLDSWDDDALLFDKPAGAYLDSARVRRVDYRGSHFRTMGPLNAARPPQGYPLLLGDGAGEADIALVAVGELVEAPHVLVKAAPDALDAALDHAHAIGAAGLHLLGQPGAATIAAVRARVGASPAGDSGSWRERLGLPHPANPFSRREAA